MHLCVSILSNISHSPSPAIQVCLGRCLVGQALGQGVFGIRPFRHSLILSPTSPTLGPEPPNKPKHLDGTFYSWVPLVPSNAVYGAHSRRAMVIPPRQQHPRLKSHCTSSMMHAQCWFRTVAICTMSVRFSSRLSTLAPCRTQLFLWSQRLRTGARGTAHRNRPTRCLSSRSAGAAARPLGTGGLRMRKRGDEDGPAESRE